MQQVLLHPGFHRTGTSSMQHFLWRNHEVLAPHVSLMMLRHMKPVIRQCGKFSLTRDPLDLLELAEMLDTAFAENPVPDGRHLIMSAEGLCGQMPGRSGVPDYSAAPMLVQYLTGYLTEKFPQANTRVIMSTRAPDEWLESVYLYQLRMTRLTMDSDAFADTYRAASDLDGVMEQIADLVDPIDVLFLPLSDATRHPKGPGCALLDQIAVPDTLRAALIPVGRGNEKPDDYTRQRFLDLNRSDLTDAEVAGLKTTIAEQANLGGWKKH
ncbi:hypothetical protein [Yoonia sp. 208BN28-4]|uniref:hypothetical protein n=1 Tax=Yoonia sp. 208BN28-4 TaxID=3126505 RepID=UPI0030984BDB